MYTVSIAYEKHQPQQLLIQSDKASSLEIISAKRIQLNILVDTSVIKTCRGSLSRL